LDLSHKTMAFLNFSNPKDQLKETTKN